MLRWNAPSVFDPSPGIKKQNETKSDASETRETFN